MEKKLFFHYNLKLKSDLIWVTYIPNKTTKKLELTNNEMKKKLDQTEIQRVM